MKLFLDDIRKPLDVKAALHRGQWEEFPSLYSWTIVRSYAAFVKEITDNGLPTVVSFDHDLSWEDAVNHGSNESGPLDYSKFKELTGLECAKWLVDYCDARNLPLPDWYVHSFNVIGRMNIASYLTCYERFKQFPPTPDSEGPKIIVPGSPDWPLPHS